MSENELSLKLFACRLERAETSSENMFQKEAIE